LRGSETNMAEIVEEAVTTQSLGPKATVTTETKNVATSTQTIEYLAYFFFGALEIFLAFRLVLKLMGASMTSGFVSAIYGITGLFILPFEGIFRRGFTQGIETTSVLEPSTLVAIIVYAVLVWGIVKLLRIFSGERQQTG
jgi:hypothetical protein